MLSNHLILCCPLLLLPFIFPRIRVFSNESALRIRWPKYWSSSFSISPSNEYSELISFRIDKVWSPCSPRDSQESFLVLQFRSINSSVLSLLWGFSSGTSDKELTCQCRNRGFTPWIGNIPWRRAWHSTPVFLSGEFHRQKILVGYSPQSHKEFMDILSFSKFQISGPHT